MTLIIREKQKQKIKFLLNELDDCLELLREAQMGIDDPRWIQAMIKLELGFSQALHVIGEGRKGFGILTNKDVKHILEND